MDGYRLGSGIKQVSGIHDKQHAPLAESNLVHAFFQETCFTRGCRLHIVCSAITRGFFADALDANGLSVRVAHQYNNRIARFHINAGGIVQIAVSASHQVLRPYFHIAVGFVCLYAEFLFPRVVCAVAQLCGEAGEISRQRLYLRTGSIVLHLRASDVGKHFQQLPFQLVVRVLLEELHFRAAHKTAQSGLDGELDFSNLAVRGRESNAARCVLHPKVVRTLQLIVGVLLRGYIDIHFTEVAVAAPRVIHDVVNVGLLLEEVFQRHRKICRLTPNGMVMVFVYPSVVSVLYPISLLVLTGLCTRRKYLHVAFHLHIVHARCLCFLRYRADGCYRGVFSISIGQRYRAFLIRGIGIHRVTVHLVGQGARRHFAHPVTFSGQVYGIFNVRCHRDVQSAAVCRDCGVLIFQQDGRAIAQLAHLYRIVCHTGGHADSCRAHIRFLAFPHRNQNGRRG